MSSWAAVLVVLGPLVVVSLLAVALVRLLRHRSRPIVTDRPLVLLLLWLGIVGVYVDGLYQGQFFVWEYPKDACGRLVLGEPPTTMYLLPLVHRCNDIGGPAVELVPVAINPLLLLGVVAIVLVHVAGRVHRGPRTC